MQYTEEAVGVLACALYQPAACLPIVSLLRSVERWKRAEIREKATATGRYEATVRSEVRVACVLPPGEGAELRREFRRRINRIVRPLIKEVWDFEPTGQTEVEIIRYSAGGHYRPHADAALDVSDRYFSVVCYLNDDFRGGRTLFPALRYASVPEPGKAIVFPSRYVHCAEPVEGGEKFIQVSWMLGPAPKRWLKSPRT
jgi:hypothetical protein